MNDAKILESVYNDFFGSTKAEVKTNEECDIDIDSLFIDEDSKNLLKKIVSYMEKHFNKEVTRYLNFNIALNTNDIDLANNITNLLDFYAKKYDYSDGDIHILSLYKIKNEDDIANVYRNASTVLITDLNAIKLNDVPFNQKFIHEFKNNLSSSKLTILMGLKDQIDEFLANDKDLENNKFIFRINSVKPDVNDIYNIIKEKCTLDEKDNIKLLDYLTIDYPNNNDDYYNYIQNVINYITFNNTIPNIEKARNNDDIFKELDELVGLTKVKKTFYDLTNLITLKNKTKDDLKINNVNLHMIFLGNPGTGKTTVARLIANILYNLKYIKTNKLIEVSSKDLVAEYVGQTAVKTMNVVEKAMGGVLFIDEAYSLKDVNNENSYNGECIATLIKAMEDYRDNLVVIFAGYTKEMQDFLNSNSGIVSRIGYTMQFDDYTNEELLKIFEGMVKKTGFVLDDSILKELDIIIDKNRNVKNFGNARFIRNVFEKTIIKHATNTKSTKNKQVLKTLTKDDLSYE